LFNVDVLAKLSAYILAQAKQKAVGNPFSVTTTAAAAENWDMHVLMRSAPVAAIVGCTPTYFDVGGGNDRTPPKFQKSMAHSGFVFMVSKALCSLWKRGVKRAVCKASNCGRMVIIC
jgi:hypothetical protein